MIRCDSATDYSECFSSSYFFVQDRCKGIMVNLFYIIHIHMKNILRSLNNIQHSICGRLIPLNQFNQP